MDGRVPLSIFLLEGLQGPDGATSMKRVVGRPLFRVLPESRKEYAPGGTGFARSPGSMRGGVVGTTQPTLAPGQPWEVKQHV